MRKKTIAAILSLILVIAAVTACGSSTAATKNDDDAVYDIYREYGDYYVHEGEKVTFKTNVYKYSYDKGFDTTKDYSDNYKFQWFHCTKNKYGEFVYTPIEGATSTDYTVPYVSDKLTYEENDDHEYLLAMFDKDEKDLSYGNRVNISSIWYSLSILPDKVDADKAIKYSYDSVKDTSKNDYVSFTTPETKEYKIGISNKSSSNVEPELYLYKVKNNVLVDEGDFDLSKPYKFEKDATYVLEWSAEGDGSIGFDYVIHSVDKNVSLNIFIDKIKLKEGGEYQLTSIVTPDQDVKYTTSDKSVAEVTKDGRIDAVKAGKCTVTAKAGNAEKTVKVTIVK